MNTVVIPAEMADLVRDGLRSQIALSAQHISSAEETPGLRGHPERYQEPLRALDALRALLQETGWSTTPSDLKIDLDTHAWALTQALQDQLTDHAHAHREHSPDDEQDDNRRAAIPRDTNALSTLALIVLLKTQPSQTSPVYRRKLVVSSSRL
jgi:hypothetical protein